MRKLIPRRRHRHESARQWSVLLQLSAFARCPPASTTDSNSVRRYFVRKHRSTHQLKADHRKVIHQSRVLFLPASTVKPSSFLPLLHRLWCEQPRLSPYIVERMASAWTKNYVKSSILQTTSKSRRSPLLALLPHQLWTVSLAVPTCVNINSWESVFSPILFSRLLHSIYGMIQT